MGAGISSGAARAHTCLARPAAPFRCASHENEVPSGREQWRRASLDGLPVVSTLAGMSVPALAARTADAGGLVVAEFFAGIGLARMGLEACGFSVRWANDIDVAKSRMYAANFGERDFVLGDIAAAKAADLPADIALAWASFPCTDLSLAGNRRGLAGSGSGTFWEFARVLDDLGAARPNVVALENVVGLSTSHGGRDIREAIRELNGLGYWVDVLTLDARRFVPQSRPRLFIVGMSAPPEFEDRGANELRPAWLGPLFSDPDLRTVRTALPPPPPLKTAGLTGLVERLPPTSDHWWDDKRTDALVVSLSPLQRQRLVHLQQGSRVTYRGAYRRTRNGVAVWEIRTNDVSGCLRTARGGSSKQALVAAGRGEVRARWMTPREYARLMGADDYLLTDATRNGAISGFGDAVCVPVISWLARHYLLPLVQRLASGEPILAGAGWAQGA
jgi:DNA (cytosine-5)-methyltransferase 1